MSKLNAHGIKLLLQEIRRNPQLWLLVFVPIALAAEKLNHEAHMLNFVFSVLAIFPLAVLLSHATESVAAKTGDSVGAPTPLSAFSRRNPIQFENMPLFSVLAFIFDIDGTLVDSNELHVDSWDRTFRRFGKQFPREQLRAQIGKGSDQYLPAFLTPEEIKSFGKELDEYRSELFRKEYLPKVRSFRKVRELFQRVHDDNKCLVLASSGKKADTEYYIDLLEISNLIEGYVSGDDADNSKPAPHIFAASLEKLGGISPADAVAVGDTRFDIEAARKAGLKTILFLCGGTPESVLREAGAIAIYRDPADFLAHYDELVTSNVQR